MLMIFGKYDEFRKRMTDTRDFEAEWMETAAEPQSYRCGQASIRQDLR